MAEIEKGDEDEVLERWMGEVEHGLLLGPPHGREGRKRLESRMVDRNADPTSKSDSEKPDGDVKKASGGVKEEPRIVVVGDRLFTDTVLAHRLSVHLGGAEDDDPKVISIHTTQLPEPRDVRLIRWVEERLSGGKVKGGKVDWGRYTREAELGEKLETSVERGQRSLGLDPRTWRVIPLLKGLGRGVGATARFLGRGVRWVWARARRRAAKLEMEVEGVKGSNVA